jgi:hypothetical protein
LSASAVHLGPRLRRQRRFPARDLARPLLGRRAGVASTFNTTYLENGLIGEGVAEMTVWYKARAYGDRTLSWSGKTVLALGLLAVLLVAAVPAALFVGVVLMLFGHVVGGLALFGASILAAGAAVVIAGLSGVRHLRKLIGRQRDRFMQLSGSDYRYE